MYRVPSLFWNPAVQIIAPPVDRNTPKPDGERRGPVLVHTGDGKGKSTAAVGLALRAHGRGKAVKIDQFMKVPSARFDEHRVFGQPGVPIEGLGDGFSWKSQDLDHAGQLARDGWARARATISAGQHFLVVLGEIIDPLAAPRLAAAAPGAGLLAPAPAACACGADRPQRAGRVDGPGRHRDREAPGQTPLQGRCAGAARH